MDNQGSTSGAADQAEIIAFLANPASYAGVDRVERFETHGNLVFLAGCEAWKIKRAVRFAYMDFSTLEKRRVACLREVDVNRRFSADLYLGCVPITRSAAGALAFAGPGEVVEWAVHMRRFAQSALLSNLARQGRMADDVAKLLADVVYDSHATAERRPPSLGTAPIRRLTSSLNNSLRNCDALGGDLLRFAHGIEDQIARVAPLLDARAGRGFVRRCHGDLHLANVVLWHGRPVFYDAMEFDEGVATIDTLYDLAFLLMDLDWHQQRHAANIVLNRYLWRSQDRLDLEGLAALPLFLALRAGIRAMVAVDRAAQEEDREGRKVDLDRARRYVQAGLRYVAPMPSRLIVIGGLSGTGKTTLAAALAALVGGSPGAVHLRSDLERKAAAGVGEFDRLPASAYTREARAHIYQRLGQKAQIALAAGRSVVVDAVYAGEEERRDAEAAAVALGIPFHGLWLNADRATLVGRVSARSRDASDATPETVATQLQSAVGEMSPPWTAIEAGGTASETLRLAATHLDIALGEPANLPVDEKQP